MHNNKVYQSGESYSSSCRSCVCESGEWKCEDESCPGMCSVLGGAHINTFDGKVFTFHGDCSYVLSQGCDGLYIVLVEMVKCGLSDSRTCLRSVTISLSNNTVIIKVQATGEIFVNQILSQLPVFTSEVSIFKPSSFYILVDTKVGIQAMVQMLPVMQVFVKMQSFLKATTAGLCGNFNNLMADDFKVMSGLVEGTSYIFANSWKASASCPDIKSQLRNPCSQGVSKEKYASFWCSKITDPKGVFAPCHHVISPDVYKANCMYDSCNCDISEPCMCGAVSAYVFACSAAGIHLKNWRETICGKYSNTCPGHTTYDYSMSSCHRTCRSLSQTDHSCKISFTPVDGCGCAERTYMNDKGQCVSKGKCPCFDKQTVIPAGESITKNGQTCICRHGALSCTGEANAPITCTAPMVYFNCTDAPPDATGTECQKSCSSYDMTCVSTDCTPGCVCPEGLVLDGKGGCIKESSCPCVHNGRVYQSGQRLTVDCNTCYCSNRKFVCTTKVCDAVCAIYGDGHYLTFDDKRFDFNGQCEYTLLQDYCGGGKNNGTFRIITKNVPCGSKGTTCSKTINIFLEENEFQLKEEHFHVLKGSSQISQVHKMGIYLVVKLKAGLVVMWDQKTSLFIKLGPQFKDKVCGLCGTYDGNSKTDFTTRSQEIVVDTLDFGNSWRISSSCPLAQLIADPCTANPYRAAWAQKQCSIITSTTFQHCHSQVDPGPYFDSCVRDSCACDTGGDCECFCTAVAAYAKACNDARTCIVWRTPKLCPIFCDYYNRPDGCEWHYKPCGADCMKTCRNPSGNCSELITALEGCYPKCPPTQPFFDEDSMKCVPWQQCGCYDSQGNHYSIGQSTPSDSCYTCACTVFGINCVYNVSACTCLVNGETYNYGEIIYSTTDGLGLCITAECGADNKIIRNTLPCPLTTHGPTMTTFIFTTPGIHTTGKNIKLSLSNHCAC
ncbi:mucin-5AC-like [Thalassophryne amazonica]|uniref:mucin-5AC-like n=1 Tax=Thalassophryne amazonica TaxID=390379 RepID=UPI001470FF70|nr:mucin-5AC-like [Thalassophryne amazonica]